LLLDSSTPRTSRKRAVVGNQESGLWYIDHSGRQAIAGKFAVASPFFKGLAYVKLPSGQARTSRFTTTLLRASIGTESASLPIEK